jgi:hypothetical protein
MTASLEALPPDFGMAQDVSYGDTHLNMFDTLSHMAPEMPHLGADHVATRAISTALRSS